MASQKDEVSDVGDSEDIPSDFFDDFNRDEFMEGLSVVDEWDASSGTAPRKQSSRTRINAEALDSVKDLRELIRDSTDDYKTGRKKSSNYVKSNSSQSQDLNHFIKPGSRRDPNKTSEAIKKDKEVKVQQFLAKTLESSDDIRPPGTELDDYFDNDNVNPIKQDSLNLDDNSSPNGQWKISREYSHSPQRSIQQSPQRSPQQSQRSPRQHDSPRFRRTSPIQGRFNRPRRSPLLFHRPPNKRFNAWVARKNYSPGRRSSPRRSPDRNSPRRPSPRRSSPRRSSPRRPSPSRRSPRRQHRSRSPRQHRSRSPRQHRSRSPRQHRSRSPRQHRSRSPRQHRSRSPRRRPIARRTRSHSRSRSSHRDNSFLYPKSIDNAPAFPHGNPSYLPELGQQYAAPMHPEFPVPGYYPQTPAYGGSFPDPYNYGVPQNNIPGPVMMPNINPVPAPIEFSINSGSAAPAMVPAPAASGGQATPFDALAQLVAEGKISQEDYLKLTPNKGIAGASSVLDTKTRVMVLTRCSQALNKLDKLLLPNRLMVNLQATSADVKYLAPKYSSPLKRQLVTEFAFTKGSVSPDQQTKQLIESIVSTLGLDKVVSKYKKKLPKDMKDAVMQTTKPLCDVCEIREATKYQDASTSTEPEYFTSTVHTQVVEQELVSSKSIFNPTGSASEGSAISIAHLTPAQLVSQLAARAKTLKQPQQEPNPSGNQFGRRPPNYEYDGRQGDQHYQQSYNNYRY